MAFVRHIDPYVPTSHNHTREEELTKANVMDLGFVNLLVAIEPSQIHGLGVFARLPLLKGMVLEDNVRREEWHVIDPDDPMAGDPCVIIWPDGKQRHHRHETGYSWMDYLNHSKEPNAEFIDLDGELELMIMHDIQHSQEVLIDYRRCGRTDWE